MRKEFAFMACSLLLVLAGCGAGHPANTNAENTQRDNTAASSVSGMDMTAKVNPETATVELPGDKFFYVSHAESARIADAYVVARAVCAKKLGIPFLASGVGGGDAPEYAMFKELGPWTEEMANRFAYTGPATLADQVANGTIPQPKDFKFEAEPPELTNEQSTLLEKKCNNTPEVKHFDEGRLDDLRPPAALELDFWTIKQTKLPKSKEYQQALKELNQCYQEVGIRQKKKKDGNNTYTVIVGADFTKVNEQQITLALKDVQCKTKVDFVNRVAQEVAKIQAPVIEKNIKEFTAWRKEVDETVKKAEAYIAAHQDVIWKG
ncbi:hypothetical protein [Mobiluncus mulieris]|uniref:hypothetical protein n=1 Tax=Mobiluncus mulieris TaxID=2052 RepID=UPI0021E2E4C9|nr:hypothetical protein [Mobiluncus mulieris]MCV0001790.1 hypothetical protein [Mobiluncus mulieris]